jgi:sterol desaturase/sphingolipid hydroxylase (fatty acid hydroxylase superfamily)
MNISFIFNGIRQNSLASSTATAMSALLLGMLLSLQLPLEAALTMAFMGTLLALGIYEHLAPYRADWRANSKEWMMNLAQFLPNGLLDNAGQLLAILIALQFGQAEQALPTVLAIPLAIVISELFAYWFHRLSHRQPWLWKIHGIHHTPSKVNLANTNTIHFLDMLLTSLFSALPLVVLGFSDETMAIALFITGIQNFIVHTNANIRPGGFCRLLMGPAHHRLHHSTITSEAQNYGTTIALWDQVFGTFVLPDRAPGAVGIAEPNAFPSPRAPLKCQLFPFRINQHRESNTGMDQSRHTPVPPSPQ